jgi:ferredoxin
VKLRVNPITCEGHGVCAELLPELISLDPWGYPLIAPGEVPRALADAAKRAAAGCPTLALLIDRSVPRVGGGGRHAGRA